MSEHPMDRMPADHGSDRYDAIFIEAPGGFRPLGDWWNKYSAAPCSDCRANLDVTFVGDRDDPSCCWDISSWSFVVAHDDGCPVLLAHERLAGS